MAKVLNFEGLGTNFSGEITKVDRKKLYGYSVVEITDNDGKACSLASLSDDGVSILTSGTTGIVKLDSKGNHIEKSAIQVVDSEGNPADKKPSSFDNPVQLQEVTSLEDYLDLNVKSIYQLAIEDDALKEVIDLLKRYPLLRFDFSYRTDYSSDDAFLLLGQDGDTVFMVTGTKAKFDFLGLQNIEENLSDDEEEEDDEMDFGMF